LFDIGDCGACFLRFLVWTWFGAVFLEWWDDIHSETDAPTSMVELKTSCNDGKYVAKTHSRFSNLQGVSLIWTPLRKRKTLKDRTRYQKTAGFLMDSNSKALLKLVNRMKSRLITAAFLRDLQHSTDLQSWPAGKWVRNGGQVSEHGKNCSTGQTSSRSEWTDKTAGEIGILWEPIWHLNESKSRFIQKSFPWSEGDLIIQILVMRNSQHEPLSTWLWRGY
jgi:hypothetical protein